MLDFLRGGSAVVDAVFDASSFRFRVMEGVVLEVDRDSACYEAEATTARGW